MLTMAAMVGMLVVAGAPADRPWTTWQPLPVVMPAPNAWDLYLQAFGRMHEIDVARGLASDQPPDFSQLKPPAKPPPQPLPDKWEIGPFGLPLPQRVALYADVLAVVRQALGEECLIPPYQSLEDTGQMVPEFARFRDFARLFAMEAEVRRSEGHFAEAADSALDCMQMAQQVATQRTIIACLVGDACESMGAKALDEAVPRLSPAQLRHVISRLATIEDRRVRLADILDGEERFALITLKDLGDDPRGLLTDERPGSEASGKTYIEARDAARVFAQVAGAWREVLGYFDQVRATERLPYRLRRPVPPATNDLARMETDFYPPFLFRFADARTTASLRQARLAARCYLLERGELPASLHDLVPTYLRPVPVDAFSGGPLRSKLSAGVFVIYSVGPDGIDDDGRPIQGRVGIKSRGDMVVTVQAAAR